MHISAPADVCTPKTEQHIKKGNIALSTSQMPGPLFSFGQNIVDKHDLQLFMYADVIQGCNLSQRDIMPAVLYGITDDLSVFFTIPVTSKYKVGPTDRADINSMLLQFEYAFINQDKPTACPMATVVASVLFPAGSNIGILPTSGGSTTPSFFIGTTWSYVEVDWYPYISIGQVFTTSKNNSKHGNTLYYQAGLGRNMGNPGGCILTGMIEINGYYATQDTNSGIKDPNSGGNFVAIGPTIWFSSDRITAEIGAAIPFVQHLLGKQPTTSYWLALDVGWKFN
jgi:hypothetical protein